MSAGFLAHRSFTHAAPVGVLLCNLGTPAAPTPSAVRRYLAEFLSDPRLIELPRWLWLPILYGYVLNFRPPRSAHAYAKIWLPEGSPLHVFSLAQTTAVAAELRVPAPTVMVALAMRYGEPSIATALTKLRESNAQHLLVLPLYPQYSGPATGSVFDVVTRELQRWRWVPEFRFINHYHNDPAYITALANSIRDHWRTCERGEQLYFSFHGLPRRYCLAGDPYFFQCHATARLIAAELGLDQRQWGVVFQSRFGAARWLEPYT
ncbi:MAG: ferrochelatase, partial [Gammaproteobacteria bacterium]